jgi:hypothetical protein
MTWLIGLFTSRIGRILAGAGALLAALVAFGASERRKGREAERFKATEADHERAEDIRDTVERNLADELRKHDDAGYRD